MEVGGYHAVDPPHEQKTGIAVQWHLLHKVPSKKIMKKDGQILLHFNNAAVAGRVANWNLENFDKS